MMRSPCWLPLSLLLSVLLSAIPGLPHRRAEAYKPESKEVQELVQKAAAFLEKATSSEAGGQALIAMALLKSGRDESHPQVQRAVAACRQLAAVCARNGVGNHCYNEAIASIFLCELDPGQYRQDIEALVQGMLARQRPNGCWGYRPHTYDDTSQTQYGVLSLWAAQANGIQVPADAVGRACNWLIRTQDKSGGWQYRIYQQGAPSGTPVEGPTMSMTAAGAGSVYICAYLLGYGKKGRANQGQVAGMPAALRTVEDKEAEEGRFLKSDAVSLASIQSSVSTGNGFMDKNMTFDLRQWNYYFMYALERHRSFQEIVEGINDPEPKWYNDGVAYLRRTQKADGTWKSSHAQATPAISTSFAVLFLTRSTKKSIRKAQEGRVRGNKGLPDDLTKIMVDASGKVVDEKETPPIEQLLLMLEDPDNPDGGLLDELPTVLTLGDDPARRKEQLARLRRMTVNGSYQARLTAVGTLAKDRDLDNVPALIFALSDPDWRVQKSARNGLRFISRKFNGFGLPEKPKRSQWQDAQKKWTNWYLSVRPDGELIE